jgi:hypothetical protein
MGLYDIYETDPPIQCPLTGALLTSFQGKCGPCGMNKWRQLVEDPVYVSGLPGSHYFGSKEDELKLPAEFTIHTSHDGKWYEVFCRSENGRWTTAELLSIDELSKNLHLDNKRIYVNHALQQQLTKWANL